jgi:hypothetical protein
VVVPSTSSRYACAASGRKKASPGCGATKAEEAALHGSSHYDLPGILRWFTANIGVHHVHHLCSRIPYYRPPRVLRDHPELRGVNRFTLLQSFQCVRLVLGTRDGGVSFPFVSRAVGASMVAISGQTIADRINSAEALPV